MKRYTAQLLAQNSDPDQWENAGQFADLDRAARFARGMLKHPDVKAGRVFDLQTGQVAITPEELLEGDQ
jgi:hypothetical protein